MNGFIKFFYKFDVIIIKKIMKISSNNSFIELINECFDKSEGNLLFIFCYLQYKITLHNNETL